MVGSCEGATGVGAVVTVKNAIHMSNCFPLELKVDMILKFFKFHLVPEIF